MKKVRRTAIWRWEDPEWRVLVHTEGHKLARVERPLPSLDGDAPKNALAAKAAKTVQKEKEKSASGNKDGGDGDQGDDHQQHEEDSPPQEDIFTDRDGWVFGDNKWEVCSPKAGMGKVRLSSAQMRQTAHFSSSIQDIADGRESQLLRNESRIFLTTTKSLHRPPVDERVPSLFLRRRALSRLAQGQLARVLRDPTR